MLICIFLKKETILNIATVVKCGEKMQAVCNVCMVNLAEFLGEGYGHRYVK